MLSVCSERREAQGRDNSTVLLLPPPLVMIMTISIKEVGEGKEWQQVSSRNEHRLEPIQKTLYSM